MIEALDYPFIQHAIEAGVLVSIACGIMGSLVVVNRSVFLAGGIAHAAYGGVGLAIFFSLPPLPTILSFATVTSIVMALLSFDRTERMDALIGVLWALGMAIGIIMVDLSPGYNVDLMSYLFGSILSVPVSDIRLMAMLVVVIVAFVCMFYRYFLAISYDREFARVRGLSVFLFHLVFMVFVALSVVMGIRVVGLVLILALLTIGPFISEQISRSLFQMMLMSCVLNCLFVMAGLWLAYRCDLTSGATIILVAGSFFILFQMTKGFFSIFKGIKGARQ